MKTSSKILKLLTQPWDPLGELPSKEEVRLRFQLCKAEARLRMLRTALKAGADVERQLVEANYDLSSVRSRLPMGHRTLLTLLTLGNLLTQPAMIIFYVQIRPMLVDMWGTPDNWYLLQFRPWAACSWQFIEIVTSSLWFASIPPVAVLVLTWFVQRKLPRWQARAVIKIVAMIEILLALAAVLSITCLLLSPLV